MTGRGGWYWCDGSSSRRSYAEILGSGDEPFPLDPHPRFQAGARRIGWLRQRRPVENAPASRLASHNRSSAGEGLVGRSAAQEGSETPREATITS